VESFLWLQDEALNGKVMRLRLKKNISMWPMEPSVCGEMIVINYKIEEQKQ
jgi:hypothetical protein